MEPGAAEPVDAEPDDALAADALAAHAEPAAFGPELRRLRLRQGTSQAALARAVHYSKAYLCKVESGSKPPTVDLARRCDDALGTSGVLTALAAARPAQRRGGPRGGARPMQLPAGIPDFTGRRAELARLDSLSTGSGRDALAVAITGSAGVGKTALAVRWARHIAGRHADGQLYLNLRGSSPAAPVRPADALGQLLRGLGLAPEEVPAEPDEASSRYRSLIDGRRMVIVLDNAASSQQVRWLLPGSPDCVVVITSRDRLTGLAASHGITRLPLDVLRADESQALLTRLLGPARVAAEPAAAADLATACAHLPLALRIAAAKLADRPASRIEEQVTQMRAGDRMGVLEVSGDEQEGVRAAFSVSYARLDPAARRMFRLFGALPGDDLAVTAAAALAERPEPDAADDLARLETASLVTQPQPGRFAMHDLLRSYADELGRSRDGAEGAAAARGRLLRYYLAVAEEACTLISPVLLPFPVPDTAAAASAASATAATAAQPARFGGPDQALAWLDVERGNLVAAAVAAAAGPGAGPAAWRLAHVLRGYFWLRRHGSDWTAVAEAGLSAARAAGHQHAQASALWSLADAQFSQGRHEAAELAYTEAAELAERVGWLDARVSVLGNLGMVYREQGQLAAAVDTYAQSLALARRPGSVAGNLSNLGIAYLELGQLERAAEYQERALAMHTESGSAVRMARTMDNLAMAYHELGRWGPAEDLLLRALPLHLQAGDDVGAAHTRNTLCALYCDIGWLDKARDEATGALAVARRTGDRTVEADSLNGLGACGALRGQWHEALALYRQAVALAADIGRYPEAIARTGLADVLLGLGRCAAAAESVGQALELARAGGFPLLEGRALVTGARVLLAAGDATAAARQARTAAAVAARVGHTIGEARALHVLGLSLSQSGLAAEAMQAWERALRSYAELGAPEAARLRETMRSGG